MKGPFPEILTFNLNWEQSPKQTDLLKMLLSIPEAMDVKQLYDVEEDEANIDQQYVFKGMICFAEGHYFSFNRRIACNF